MILIWRDLDKFHTIEKKNRIPNDFVAPLEYFIASWNPKKKNLIVKP